MAGYHVTDIRKGVLGEVSKIQEELDELKDATLQQVRLMELVELSDIFGAMRAYLQNHHPGYSMRDIEIMSEVTERAFKSGHRGEKKK